MTHPTNPLRLLPLLALLLLTTAADTAKAATKNAFTAIHYEGTPLDAEYLLGLRTLIASVRASGSQADFVVLASPNVCRETRETLEADGAVVRVVENVPNPFATDAGRRRTYKPRFAHTFNKLLVWNMTEYERVVYMDEDNVALAPREELEGMFRCGHFCAPYMNPLFFHTGVMVVKPDRQKFEELLRVLNSKESFSYDGADQGFLTAVFRDMERAPIFDARQPRSEEPMQRLPLAYNTNHAYFYKAFDWAAESRDPVLGRLAVPVATVGFPIAQFLKPWVWWPSLYFDQHRTWQRFRATLPSNDAYWFAARVLAWPAVLYAMFWALHLASALLLARVAAASRALRAAAARRPDWLAVPAALASVVAAVVVFVNPAVEKSCPPVYAWPVFLLYFNAGVWFFLRAFAALLLQRGAKRPLYARPPSVAAFLGAAVPEAGTQADAFLVAPPVVGAPRSREEALVPRLDNMAAPLAAQLATIALGHLPLYGFFVSKLYVILAAVVVCVVAIVSQFRRVAAAAMALDAVAEPAAAAGAAASAPATTTPATPAADLA